MAEALQEIKASMGPDALLLSTKEIPRRSGVWGRSSGFEVVAASDNSEDLDVFASSSEREQEDARLYSPETNLTGAYAGASSMVYTPAMLAKNVSATSKGSLEAEGKSADTECENAGGISGNPFKGVISLGLYRELVLSGVDESLARTLLLSALGSLSTGQRRSRPNLVRSLGKATLDLISLPSNQNGIPEKRIVAFVGPTGVGKTTALAKLAAHLALKKKTKVVLMTLDGNRIGAVEQLRTYAGLMGIPFRFVEDVSELPQAIAENNQRDYILIDTAGRSPKDLGAMRGLADFLKQSDQMERHLVLSASTKPSDMRNIMDQFEICNPSHLLFTKLDETSTPGPILNELVRTRKCFSYYTDGLRVPDDLHAAPADNLMDIVLQRNDNAIKD